MTYVAVPFLNWTIDNDNHVILGAYSQAANDYQYRYRYNSESTYYYVSKVPYRQKIFSCYHRCFYAYSDRYSFRVGGDAA